MARLSRHLSEQDYESLVMELLQSEYLDFELSDCHSAYLKSNPKFYLMMHRAIEKIRNTNDKGANESVIFPIDILESKLEDLEKRLYENTDIIPADLPDSIH